MKLHISIYGRWKGAGAATLGGEDMGFLKRCTPNVDLRVMTAQ